MRGVDLLAEQQRRGRPRKNPTKEQEETIQRFCEQMKSPSGSIQFANKITTSMKDIKQIADVMTSNGMYQPIFSEQLEQAISFYAESSSSEELAMWLQKPEQNADNLRALSHYLENASLQYGRAINTLSDIKSYNYDLRCATPNLAELVHTEEYKKSRAKAMSTLRKLNIPYQIKRVDGKTAKDGVSFVWFNKTSDTYDLLDLPTEYCYITAPWTYGYLFAIDLTYFDQFAYQETQVPELWKAYETFCKMRIELVSDKNPQKSLVPYQYYSVSPSEGWCVVFDNNRPTKTPPMIGGAQAAIDSLGYRALIKQKAVIDLWRVLAFKIPMNTTTNKMSITYDEATQIIETIRSVLPENFVAISSPFDVAAPINADQTSVMEELETISNDMFYDYSGIPNALYNSTIKSSTALKLATDNLFAYSSSSLYSGMQNLVNWILRIECGSKFDWHIVFHGNKLNEEYERQEAAKLYTTMNAPVSYVMSRFGFEPFDIENMYIMENASGIKDMMKPIQMGNATSFVEEGGRPETSGGEAKAEITEEVEDTGNSL